MGGSLASPFPHFSILPAPFTGHTIQIQPGKHTLCVGFSVTQSRGYIQGQRAQASMRLQGLSDNTCQVPGLLQTAGSFVYFKLGLLCLTCFFLTPFNKFSTPHGFFLSSYSRITQFFPPTSSPILNSRQQVGWPPNVTTESMKSKGRRFHGFAARSSDVFLFSEPETPASTHQVTQAQPTQVRQ